MVAGFNLSLTPDLGPDARVVICKPALEYIFPQKSESDFFGLTKDGRTVNWMRNVQAAVTAPFTLLGAIIGGMIGTACGAVATGIITICNAAALKKGSRFDTVLIMGAGTVIGAIVGGGIAATPSQLAGSVISSIVVPPIAGAANLLAAAAGRVAGPYKAS